MSRQELIKLITLLIKLELETYKGSTSFYELEVFVGTILAQLTSKGILTKWEEVSIRRKLEE